MRPILILLLLVLSSSFKSFANDIRGRLPEIINPNMRYIFYSHGYIVEGRNKRPEHPRWGVYDYPAIVDALSEPNAIVIAEHRPKNTNPFTHAKKLQGQVERLIKNGVPEKNISLVGFSRGGFITAITSSYLANKKLNFVILAACTSSLADREDINLYGNILSIYETSDGVGSCNDAVTRSGDKITSFKEQSISTSKEHGAFYRPNDEWIEPVKKWLEREHVKIPFTIPSSEVVDIIEPSTKRIYPLFIKLPRSYNMRPDARYPVIYMTDAPYSFPLVVGATRNPMNNEHMEQAIIVAVSYSKGSKGSSSRVRDYTPVKADDWKMETGNAKGHLEFFKNVVFPFIESNYRVDKTKRTLAGVSLGGLFGAYVLFNEPETFNGYVLGSPSVWFNNHHLLSIEAREPKQKTRVYLSVGVLETPEFGEGQDMVMGAQLLAKKINDLSSSNIALKFSTVENSSHSTAFPTTAIQGLSWIHGK